PEQVCEPVGRHRPVRDEMVGRLGLRRRQPIAGEHAAMELAERRAQRLERGDALLYSARNAGLRRIEIRLSILHLVTPSWSTGDRRGPRIDASTAERSLRRL